MRQNESQIMFPSTTDNISLTTDNILSTTDFTDYTDVAVDPKQHNIELR